MSNKIELVTLEKSRWEEALAKIEELEALNQMHLPTVEMLHRILTQRPYPVGTEWQFIEAWADQFIRLNKKALKEDKSDE